MVVVDATGLQEFLRRCEKMADEVRALEDSLETWKQLYETYRDGTSDNSARTDSRD